MHRTFLHLCTGRNNETGQTPFDSVVVVVDLPPFCRASENLRQKKACLKKKKDKRPFLINDLKPETSHIEHTHTQFYSPSVAAIEASEESCMRCIGTSSLFLPSAFSKQYQTPGSGTRNKLTCLLIMNVASTSNHCPVPKVGLDDSSACGKATDAVINSGTGTVQSNASATKTIAQGDDLFGIAQALTSLSRKVSGTDASASSSASEAPSHKQPAHATQGQALPASNSAVRTSSSSIISETDWNTTTTTTTTCSGMSSSSLSSMSDQQQSNLAEGSNISENDPNDDQANGRFPDILRFMMDYATAEGCNKSPGQRAASWSDDGKSIVILDKVLFCEQVLPLFFKKTKFPSFVRKLFRWGFSRVTSKAIRRSKQQIFTHPKFVRLVPSNSNVNSAASTGIPSTIAAAGGAMTMPNAFIQAQAGAVVPTSVSPLQVNGASPRMIPPASDASQLHSVAMPLSSNVGIQATNHQDEAVAKLLHRRQQLEVEWEILQEEAKLKGVVIGSAHPPLPSAAPMGTSFLPNAATNPNNFYHAHAHALGVGGTGTMLASSSMQPSLEQAYMALNDANGTFRPASLGTASAPAASIATVPQALPGQSFFTPQAVRAAIAARAAALPRPQTATAAMVAGGHLPAPSLPGRPEPERGIFNTAVHIQALQNSS